MGLCFLISISFTKSEMQNNSAFFLYDVGIGCYWSAEHDLPKINMIAHNLLPPREKIPWEIMIVTLFSIEEQQLDL